MARARKRIRAQQGIHEVTVRSLEGFVTEVRSFQRLWRSPHRYIELWFRGQNDARQKLIPRVYRQGVDFEDEGEDELRYEFQARAVQFPMGQSPGSDWEWYFLMQHYGAPTRLLDWSDGALLALHFAFRSHDGATDAAVWVLDPWWLIDNAVSEVRDSLPKNDPRRAWLADYLPDPKDPRTDWVLRYLPQPFSGTKLPKYPAAVRPPHFDRRIAAQLSAFTIHGELHDGLGQLALRTPNARVGKIRIPSRHVERIQSDLEVCGIVETTVFQDLEGLGRELSHDFGGSPVVPPNRRAKLRP
jgi:hypothetical protein